MSWRVPVSLRSYWIRPDNRSQNVKICVTLEQSNYYAVIIMFGWHLCFCLSWMVNSEWKACCLKCCSLNLFLWPFCTWREMVWIKLDWDEKVGRTCTSVHVLLHIYIFGKFGLNLQNICKFGWKPILHPCFWSVSHTVSTSQTPVGRFSAYSVCWIGGGAPWWERPLWLAVQLSQSVQQPTDQGLTMPMPFIQSWIEEAVNSLWWATVVCWYRELFRLT